MFYRYRAGILMALFIARIEVGLKKGVADPEGENTRKTLSLLGMDVKEVKTAKVYDMVIEAKTEKKASEIAEQACERLLANPVINAYMIKIRAKHQ